MTVDIGPRLLDPLEVSLASTQLVEASAGTGKTYTIGGLYLRLVVENQLTVSQILVVTFTKAATAELRQRIRDRLHTLVTALTEGVNKVDDPFVAGLVAKIGRGRARNDAIMRVREAIADFDHAAIFTIHGYCQRLLAEAAFETGSLFDAELVPDDRPLIERAVHDFWAATTADVPLPIASYCRDNKLMPHALVSLMHRVANDPDVSVIGADEPPDLAPLLEPWLAAWQHAAAVWRRDCKSVLSALTDPALKQNVYRPDTVRRSWSSELDAAFAIPRVGRFSDPDVPVAKRKDLAKLAHRLTPEGLAEGTKKNKTPPSHPLFTAIAELVACDEALAAACAAFVRFQQRRCIETVFPRLAEYKARRGQQSYADLLREVDAALQSDDGDVLRERIAEQYKAALIDEFQDTDPMQFRIFREAWPTRRPMFLIGDPKQAIYAFRGADLYAYLRAVASSETRAHGLGTNWRSDPGLIAGINAVFDRPAHPFALPQLSFHPVRARDAAHDRLVGPPELTTPLDIAVLGQHDELFRSTSEAELACTLRCVHDIVGLLDADVHIDEARVRARDIAVLTRSNKQAIALQAELARANVTAVLHSNSSVFDTPQAEELVRIVAAIDDPGDGPTLRAACSTVALGYDASTLAAMSDDTFERWVERFRRAALTWRRGGCYRALDELFAAAEVERRLLALVGGERMLTNLLHLTELTEQASSAAHFGPTAALEWLDRLRTNAQDRTTEVGDTSQLRLEDDADAVQIITTHRAKGLEYPIVFCPFAGAPTRSAGPWPQFHDAANAHTLTLDLGSARTKEHEQLAEHEAFAEELRLIYVALTRAKHRCSVYSAPVRGKAWSALTYLLHFADTRPGEGPDASDADQIAANASGPLATSKVHVERVASDGIAALAHDLTRLTARAPAFIRVHTADVPIDRPRWSRPVDATTRGGPRPVTRELGGPWRSTSFSALVHHIHDEVDHDGSAHTDRPPSTATPRPIEAFPGGARAGEFFHRVLETLDFGVTDPEAVQAHVLPLARRFGFAEDTVTVVAEALLDALATPLDDARHVPALRSITRAHRIDEMPFALAVRHDQTALDASTLWGTLQRTEGPLARYAAEQSHVVFPPLCGFLRGYVDLVFEHDGRYFLVDYKSNKLGADPNAYGDNGMWAEMVRHHYPLQYLVYAVALHRHLKLRLGGYDPARHFGGVYYLFVRGMQPGRDAGVFRDPLAPADLERLDALFAGSSGGSSP